MRIAQIKNASAATRMRKNGILNGLLLQLYDIFRNFNDAASISLSLTFFFIQYLQVNSSEFYILPQFHWETAESFLSRTPENDMFRKRQE